MTTTKRFTLVPVERKDIEYPSDSGRQYLTEAIADLARLWIAEGRPSRAELTISGYNDDPRELFEIPEVCQWANRIANEFPVLLFFLNEMSIDRFISWLCGPVSRQEVTSRAFIERYDDTKMKCVARATVESSEFLKSIGADQRIVSQFYIQIMADRAAQRESQEK